GRRLQQEPAGCLGPQHLVQCHGHVPPPGQTLPGPGSEAVAEQRTAGDSGSNAAGGQQGGDATRSWDQELTSQRPPRPSPPAQSSPLPANGSVLSRALVSSHHPTPLLYPP